MSEVKIATYNVSFASDLGEAIGSEKHFLTRTPEDNKRQFFENSIEHAVQWCKKEPTWGAIGFQEMNTPQNLSGYNDSSPKTGVEYVIDEFKNKDKSPMPSPGNSFVADTPVRINPLYNESEQYGSVKTKFGFSF